MYKYYASEMIFQVSIPTNPAPMPAYFIDGIKMKSYTKQENKS